MTTHVVREQKCLKCNEYLDRSTNADGSPNRPKEGDITICIYCSHIMEFDGKGNFRNRKKYLKAPPAWRFGDESRNDRQVSVILTTY